MNEHVAIQWPELNLARELPFKLAATLVRPAALEVEHGGQTTALEPRVMKVLVALHRSRGQPVSRDELIDLCWGGRIVTEGALNRCVAQLRKALAADPAIRVDTIATVGYRLQLGEASPAPPPAGPPANDVAAPSSPLSRRSMMFLGAGAVVATGAVGGLLAALPHRVNWTTAAYRPLTSDRGLETHPALSPAGDQIVYAQRGDRTQRRDLYLRGVRDGTPVRLTSDPADDHSAAWSPRGDRIAFVRTYAEGPCSLVIVPVPLGPERVVGRCQTSPYTRLSWIDERTLVYGDRPKITDVSRIRALDIETGAFRDLTSPSADTLGDADPMVSPDGHQVVFRRSLMHGADDLFLLDLRTGRERALTNDGWKANGYVWSADSRHIFYSSNRGGEFGLWTVDTRIDGPSRQISLGLGQVSFSRMSSDRGNHLAVEIPQGRSIIAAVQPNGAFTPVTDATNWDWDPAGAADGAVAYVSSRSGSSEMWVTRPDGVATRLTSLIASYVTAPAWSPDGARIIFVAVKGRRSEVYIVDRDGGRLRPLTSDGPDKLTPAFMPDGRSVLYVERTGRGYRLMQLAIEGQGAPAPVSGGEGWSNIRRTPDGRFYGVRAGGERVQPLFGGGPASDARLIGNDEWTVSNDGVFVLRGRRDPIPSVWFHPWAGGGRKWADVPDSAGSIGTSVDGRVLVAQDLDYQIDLGLIDLKTV
jgi:Tol biopolymer transport system component